MPVIPPVPLGWQQPLRAHGHQVWGSVRGHSQSAARGGRSETRLMEEKKSQRPPVSVGPGNSEVTRDLFHWPLPQGTWLRLNSFLPSLLTRRAEEGPQKQPSASSSAQKEGALLSPCGSSILQEFACFRHHPRADISVHLAKLGPQAGATSTGAGPCQSPGLVRPGTGSPARGHHGHCPRWGSVVDLSLMTPLITNGLETASSSRDASSLFTLNREQQHLLDTPATPSSGSSQPVTNPSGHCTATSAVPVPWWLCPARF